MVVGNLKKYEFFEHTADIGIRAFGKTLKELFANAATGMFEIIAAKKQKADTKKQKAKEFKIIKQADSLENLLVEWLDELLFLFATKNIVFEKFGIEELDEKHIKAIVFGLAAKNFDIKTEVKAVTYHMLEIKKHRNNWQAQVIFDV